MRVYRNIVNGLHYRLNDGKVEMKDPKGVMNYGKWKDSVHTTTELFHIYVEQGYLKPTK